jgi:hypothetical protein
LSAIQKKVVENHIYLFTKKQKFCEIGQVFSLSSRTHSCKLSAKERAQAVHLLSQINCGLVTFLRSCSSSFSEKSPSFFLSFFLSFFRSFILSFYGSAREMKLLASNVSQLSHKDEQSWQRGTKEGFCSWSDMGEG